MTHDTDKEEEEEACRTTKLWTTQLGSNCPLTVCTRASASFSREEEQVTVTVVTLEG